MIYSIRSERQLMEQLDYNLLYRWFVGLGIDDAVRDATTFTKNRDRLLEGDVAEAFFAAVLAQAEGQALLSREHFTVDGTLIEAWASQESFRPRDEEDPPPDGGTDFRGQRRSNTTPTRFLFWNYEPSTEAPGRDFFSKLLPPRRITRSCDCGGPAGSPTF